MPQLRCNSVQIAGNATRDPEVRYVNSDRAICSFGVALDNGYYDKQSNEWKEKPAFFDVKVWGKAGEKVAEKVSKGTPVFIEGSLDFQQWEKGGQKHSKVEITAFRVQVLERSKGGPSGSGGGQPKPQSESKPEPQDSFYDDGPDEDVPF